MTKNEFERLMNYSQTNDMPTANGKPMLGLFANSFAQLNEYDKKLSFDCDSGIEASIMDFLDAAGFMPDDNGYKYLKYILFSCTKRLSIPSKIGVLYSECAKAFGVSVNCIDVSISKAISSAVNSYKLYNINSIFKIDLFSDDEKPTNALFISSVCNRMVYCKKYGIQVPFRA